ncbi:5-oxoprolinase subunit PxpA [Curtobacterium sp. VKM Ac-2887]|uniref:5-oxoprolinase subunit PxpA n=1 Tax=Curtobacterium sp. VKM Ac-2887 TaxID=2783819 RepID=UPI00188B24CA|nr:5-oxoprolinase subunit PxpA [Curtobacterium sp. VKM Ac-2887]MBF4588274.1 5-oxoprolinase subunit PxpA [Curtobacterium sp. VKM Ac-2887]
MATASVAVVADLGESYGNYTIGDDEALLGLVTASNIACGFHAGDPRVIDRTVAECVKRGIELGAHPGYPDLVGFGRRLIEASEEEIRTDVLYQIGALDAFARVHGGTISHVAPHGRMGSIAQTDAKHARAITDAIAAYDPSYIVICQNGLLAEESRKRDLQVGYVFLADRGYGVDGMPVARSHPGGLLHDPEEIGRRVVQVVTEGTVVTVDGETVPLGHDADVVLLHGDHPEVLANGTALRAALDGSGVRATGLQEVLADKRAAVAAR